MESEQKSTEVEVTMPVGIMVLELLEKQQDQFFMKIAQIEIDDQVEMGIALDCCGDPIFAEISAARYQDDESDIIQVYYMNYIDTDDYLDYVKEKRSI